MRKIAVFLILFFNFIFIANGKTIEEKLIDAGAWFLFSSRFEQQEGETVLTQVEFFKKEDVSSLLFDNNNRLYSIFSDKENEMNEDLWKMFDNNTFVITSLTGETMQIMEIVELSEKKLVIRYCEDIKNKIGKCIISTYFTTKAGWLSDIEIDRLNSAGIIELQDTTP